MVHGANTVTLSEETESNRENKPAPKVTKAHIYSTWKSVSKSNSCPQESVYQNVRIANQRLTISDQPCGFIG